MTARGLYTLLFGVLMLVTALSVGSAGAFLLGASALFACLVSLVCVAAARFSCRFRQAVQTTETQRGGVCRYMLGIRFRVPAPIAPLTLSVALPNGRQNDFQLPTHLFHETRNKNDLSCPHVGLFPVGVTKIGFSDCFGLFQLHMHIRTPLPQLCVLPQPKKAEPLAFSPGEGESNAAQRAQADHSTPEDIRAWQDGDELKRVHWKLSARRQSLMVHTYETPQRPDALVLLNRSVPEGPLRLLTIDTLCEACAGIIQALLEAGRFTRLPLSDSSQGEISGQNTQALPQILRALAKEHFSCTEDFSRALWLAAKRTQRTGSIAVLSAELTPDIAEAALALSRMGPHMRFVLVTDGALDDTHRRLLYLLHTNGVETAHIQAA